jgi:hypothetical protein
MFAPFFLTFPACPILSISGFTASGWTMTSPCTDSPAHSCSNWCADDTGFIQIELDFAEYYSVSEFTLYLLNEIYTSNYQLNITNNEVAYNDTTGDPQYAKIFVSTFFR